MLRKKVVFTVLLVVLVSSVWVGLVSAGQEKVTVCHKPGTADEKTLEISAKAEAAHLAHGDTQGECAGPQSNGCTALNEVTPDLQTDDNSYYFGVSDLEFYLGETIHVDMTIIADVDGAKTARAGVTNYNNDSLARDFLSVAPGETGTVSVDYVVVAGDNASIVSVGVYFFDDDDDDSFTLDAAHISCTPAP